MNSCFLTLFSPVAPDAVSQPNVDKIEKDGVTLSWQKPTNDGGAPIEGYIVEKKAPGSDEWVPCNVSPIRDTNFKAPCKEGEENQFRVRAVNSEGPGEPSRPTGVIKAENQPGERIA